jgi:hypothetical protein
LLGRNGESLAVLAVAGWAFVSCGTPAQPVRSLTVWKGARSARVVRRAPPAGPRCAASSRGHLRECAGQLGEFREALETWSAAGTRVLAKQFNYLEGAHPALDRLIAMYPLSGRSREAAVCELAVARLHSRSR